MKERRNEDRAGGGPQPACRCIGLANCITGCRMLCSAALLLFPAFSPPFYALYLTAGLSDMADGAVARSTHTVSEFGSRLDTAADILFVAACFFKLLPALDIPAWLWVWAGIIAVIKAITLGYGWRTQGKLAAVHSPLNRATGLVVFCLPLLAGAVDLTLIAAAACALATWAAVQENGILRAGRGEGGAADEKR